MKSVPDVNPLKLWREVIARIPKSHDWLIREVTDEINDPDFVMLRHGTRHTRNKGCHGPLCKKALRDQQIDRRRRAAHAVGLEPRPYSRSTAYVVMDPMLAAMKRAHDREFDMRRKEPTRELISA